MSVILDTHVFFWWITGSDRLPAQHRALIEAGTEPVFVSAVTCWEMAIKVKLGKWPDAAPLIPELEHAIEDEGFLTLAITPSQAKMAGSLDLKHRDPFDRLLAAQSICLNVPIATIDPALGMLGAAAI